MSKVPTRTINIILTFIIVPQNMINCRQGYKKAHNNNHGSTTNFFTDLTTTNQNLTYIQAVLCGVKVDFSLAKQEELLKVIFLFSMSENMT